MKKISFIIFLWLFLFSVSLSFGQVTEIEKTYKLDGKAKRGYLKKVVYDPATKNYNLIYFYKSGKDKLLKLIYTFDHDFNFVKLDEKEILLQNVTASDLEIKAYKGENYEVVGLSVSGNLMGTLVLKKKRIYYGFDWLWLTYKKKVEILEKVKPKSDNGKTYFYFNHVEDDVTGDVYILVGERDNDQFGHYKNMHILKYNQNIELIKDLTLPFNYYEMCVYTEAIPKIYNEDVDNPGVGGIVYLFHPLNGKKFTDPDNTNCSYIKVDENLNIVENIPYHSKASYWNVDDIIMDGNSSYIYGASTGENKYMNDIISPTKFKSVQLMKISSGKLDYVTATDLDIFDEKLKLPPNQKKSPEYKGKNFEIKNYFTLGNNEFLVVGQNYKLDNNVKKYTDLLAFQFNDKGELKAQYSIDTKENNDYSKKFGTYQNLMPGTDSKNLYWFLQEIKGYSDWYEKVLTYPRLCKIDINGASMNDIIDYGNGDYFLDPNFPYLSSGEANKLVFFGSNKKGNELWFVRVKLD